MSSRLFQEAREERGLCYSIFSFAAAHADTGTLGVYAGTDPGDVGELVTVVGRTPPAALLEDPDRGGARPRPRPAQGRPVHGARELCRGLGGPCPPALVLRPPDRARPSSWRASTPSTPPPCAASAAGCSPATASPSRASGRWRSCRASTCRRSPPEQAQHRPHLRRHGLAEAAMGGPVKCTPSMPSFRSPTLAVSKNRHARGLRDLPEAPGQRVAPGPARPSSQSASAASLRGGAGRRAGAWGRVDRASRCRTCPRSAGRCRAALRHPRRSAPRLRSRCVFRSLAPSTMMTRSERQVGQRSPRAGRRCRRAARLPSRPASGRRSRWSGPAARRPRPRSRCRALPASPTAIARARDSAAPE